MPSASTTSIDSIELSDLPEVYAYRYEEDIFLSAWLAESELQFFRSSSGEKAAVAWLRNLNLDEEELDAHEI